MKIFPTNKTMKQYNAATQFPTNNWPDKNAKRETKVFGSRRKSLKQTSQLQNNQLQLFIGEQHARIPWIRVRSK